LTSNRLPVDIGIDGHVHTSLCRHASGSMAEYVTSAIRAGLHSIIFLEHLEAGIKNDRRTWLSTRDFASYFATGKQLQQQYGGRIRIFLGVEIGWNPHAVEELQEILQRFPWQWRGLSYHFYWNGSRHLNLVSHNQEEIRQLIRTGPERILNHYFHQIIQAHQTLACDVVCHLDAALRHVPGIKLTADHLHLIQTLFQDMKRKGTRLEINTSGLAMRGLPFPDPEIVHLALRHGICLQAGSDAHHPDQVGRFFHLLPDLLKDSDPGR